MRLHFCLLFCLIFLGSLPVATYAGPTPPADQYCDFALRACDQVEQRLPELTKLAEVVAARHLDGGIIGVIWEPPSSTGPQGPQYELRGRSGGMSALDNWLAKQLPTAHREKDVAIIGWQRAPGPHDLDILRKYHEKFFVIAFGPRGLPALADEVKLADAWIDTGQGDDDHIATLGKLRAGHGNTLLNVLNSWAFMGELVAALTRHGKMPTMLKSHMWDDEKAWNERYRQKLLFHDDLTVAPIPAGTLSRRYLDAIRALVRQFAATQMPAVQKAAALIAAELAQGRQTLVAQSGHTTYEHVGQYEDRVWAVPTVLYDTPGRLRQWPTSTPDGALVLRVGYCGEDKKIMDILRAKKQRVILIAVQDDHRPDFKLPDDLATMIDMGWDFGDACVTVEGYPIRIFPPSGVMQLVAYEAVNLEVLSRLPQPNQSAP